MVAFDSVLKVAARVDAATYQELYADASDFRENRQPVLTG
jgi:hypothetical protein